MALVMSPWFGRGRSTCGRRAARPYAFCSPSLFTDLVIIKVPVPALQRPACAPAGAGTSPATSNARVVQWAETPEGHTFTLRLPGLKKEDVQIQVEDDRTLYINYSHQQPKDDSAKEPGTGSGQQSKPTPGSSSGSSSSSSCSFKRKFKLPETADLEQIKAEVTNETLTVTVPKLKVKTSEPRRNIEISEGGEKSDDANKPSTSTA